jgi:hypothetical protein
MNEDEQVDTDRHLTAMQVTLIAMLWVFIAAFALIFTSPPPYCGGVYPDALPYTSETNP